MPEIAQDNSTATLQLIPVAEIDEDEFCQHAWLTVNGVTTNSNSTDLTFDIDAPSMYLPRRISKSQRPIFPVRANHNITSPRYKNRKPSSDSGNITRFVIDVDSVTHLGQAPPPTAPTSATIPDSSVAQKPGRKLAFSFSQRGGSKRRKGKETEGTSAN